MKSVYYRKQTTSFSSKTEVRKLKTTNAFFGKGIWFLLSSFPLLHILLLAENTIIKKIKSTDTSFPQHMKYMHSAIPEQQYFEKIN